MASSSSPLPATTPSVASLWPEMPFVAEWSTRSTPSVSGCWRIGVAKVESTSVNGPSMAPSSARSVRASCGLAGVSAITSTVRPGATASANAPGTVASTNVTSMPKRAHAPARNSCVPL